MQTLSSPPRFDGQFEIQMKWETQWNGDKCDKHKMLTCAIKMYCEAIWSLRKQETWKMIRFLECEAKK